MNLLCALLFGIFVFGTAHAQVEIVTLARLEKVMSSSKDTVYVINFWATWCKPCIEELPYFEEAHTFYATSNVRILLVSLDMPSELERTLVPFIQKKKLQSEIVLLNEPDPNIWIDKIESTWTGSLPATLIFNGSSKKRMFYEKQISKEELFSTIQQMKE
ncbi:MAG: TlpA family protein disulfide reductase [Ignavibacteria bacterium]|jgi:thiol-disulfide isomerase/thioredoxin